MISSSLRHTQRHLQRDGKRWVLTSNNSIRSSRFIPHNGNTTRFISSSVTTNDYIIHHALRRRKYDAISGTAVQQFRHQSDLPPEHNVDGGSKPHHHRDFPLVINKSVGLPEYYSSPLYVLKNRNMKTVEIRECETVKINHDTWYTAAILTKFGVCHSGTFGEFTKELNPSLAQSELMNINGKNYYKTKEVAIEAAAARVIDLYSNFFKHKYTVFSENEDSFITLRYCVEEPELSGPDAYGLDWIKSSLEEFAWQLHAPINFLENIFRTKYNSTTGGCFLGHGDRENGYTASFTDPITSEVFHSGLIGKINAQKKKGGSLQYPPLDEAIVKVRDGRVYYPNNQLANHAAAARAIDCYIFREGSEELAKKYQLCLEDPYRDEAERDSQHIDYDTLLLDDRLRQRFSSGSNENAQQYKGAKTFTSIVSSSASQLHVPMNMLERLSRPLFGDMYPNNSFKCTSVERNGKLWHTATFTSPTTSEVFSSGLARHIDVEKKRGATLSPSLSEAEVLIIDGKVYYEEERFAKHAAAARAIDCYMFREGSDELTKKYQLCLEDPYKDVTERDAQHIDYGDLSERRCLEDKKLINENAQQYKGEKTFKSIVSSSAFQLHVPMNILEKFSRQVFGSMYPNNSFKCTSIKRNGKLWYTATFTSPTTSEDFSSGLARHIDVEKKEGATLSPSLSEAEVLIIDGKVYYEEEKFAKHAAAARAVDCYMFREGSDELTKKYQLCLEDPYKDVTERDGQHIDYDDLLERRCVENKKLIYENAQQEKTFKSIVSSSAFQLHVPMNILEKFSRQVFGGMYPNDSFKCTSIKRNGKLWYTATFTSPIKSEVFSSGLARHIDVEKKEGATLLPLLSEAEVLIIGGKVYYEEERFAKHAAAARAVDCYMFREGSDELTKKYQLCLEDPYKDVTEREGQHIDYGDLLERRGPGKNPSEFGGSSVEESLWKLHKPLVFLNMYQAKKLGTDYSTAGELSKDSIEIGKKTWHTATFTDPQTSEVFHAGLVGPINVEQREGMVLSPPLDEVETRIVDGKVYYDKYQYAKHAAAARAIDCYLYRDKKALGEAPEYQLCLEDPYSESEMKEIDYHALTAMKTNAKMLDSADIMMPYLDESDDKFTIISRSYSDLPTRVDQKLSTLGRIAEIWAETPSQTSVSRASSKITSSAKASEDPTENIIKWFKRVAHTPSNFEQAIAFSQLCNKTLLALAKENAEKVINSKASCADCTELQIEAKSILDKLMSISSDFASENESIVNAETLNAYIQCLSRIDVEDSAAAAQDILIRMSEEDNLPSPNTETYNVVMKLWSLVDSEKGKKGVNDTLSHLQNAAMVREDLRPNRDTFQILLAANAKENNHFKYDLALASLERINALSQDLCGEPFIPEADDYAAALKKTSTNCLLIDDYQPSWFWHGQEYDGGFKPMNDDRRCEALDMEKWLEHAQEMGTCISDDMYFQVIKTWASTGSLEGLIGGDGAHGAEELAKKSVVRSEGAPSIDVFSPIIAAWALCGEKLGPDRVKEWIDQISLLGMKPDLDLQVAYFIAVEKWQSKLIGNVLGNDDGTNESIREESIEEAGSEGSIDSLFKAAQNCSRYLEEITSNKNMQDIADLDAFTSILRYNIKAWSRASASVLLLPNGSSHLDATQGVEEMAKVLKHINLSNLGPGSSDTGEAQLNAAGKVYTEFMSQLLYFDSIRNGHVENNDKCYFADRIADVEHSLRSFEFHSRRLASDAKLSPESNDVRHNLYREILRGCAGVKLSTDYGHMLRICTLIMDCLSWHHDQTRGSSKEAEDITDMFCDVAILSATCVKNPYERMNVLRSIYDRASCFFNKKNPHHDSNYGRVDRATLLGSMRRALGESEMTDSFLSSFEEEKQGRKRRASRQRGRS